MPKPTHIVVSCDPEPIDQRGIWKNVEFCTSAALNGSHVALSQHLSATQAACFLVYVETPRIAGDAANYRNVLTLVAGDIRIEQQGTWTGFLTWSDSVGSSSLRAGCNAVAKGKFAALISDDLRSVHTTHLTSSRMGI